jgi:tetratricopeptide (TPR) repeat protein
MDVSHQFIESVNANLGYWIEKGKEIPRKDHANVLRGVDFGLRLGETFSKAIDLAIRSYPLVERIGNFWDWIRVLEKQAHSQKDHIPEDDCNLYILLGLFLVRVSEHRRAGRYLSMAYDHASSLGIVKQTGAACYGLCLYYWGIKKFEKAEQFGVEALTHYRTLDQIDLPMGETLNALGMVAFSRKNYTKAESFFQEARDIGEGLEEELLIGRSLNNLAMVNETTGKYKEALVLFGQAAESIKSAGNTIDLCRSEVARGVLHYKLGNIENAQAAFQRAVHPEWEDDLSPIYRAWVSLVRGYVCLIDGEREDAIELFQISVAYWERVDDEQMLEYALSGLTEAKG